MNPNRQRGSAMILAIAVLAVLLALLTTFCRFLAIERDVARTHRLAAQARMNAESGVEHFLAFMTDHDNFEPAYHLAESGPGDPGYWLFKNQAGDGVGTGLVDIADAARPSFHSGSVHGQAISGVPIDRASRIDRTSSFYRLKVIDTASQINLNNPIGSGLNSPLETLLVNLGQAIERLARSPEGRPAWWRAAWGPVPNPLPPSTVERIIDRRRRLGPFESKEDLRTDEHGNRILSDLEWDLVRDYVAVQGFANRRTSTVLMPQTRVGNPGYPFGNLWYRSRPPAPGFRKASGRAPGRVDEEIVPDLQPRYPVNINTAPLAVLIACLQGLGEGSLRRQKSPSTAPPFGFGLAITGGGPDQRDHAGLVIHPGSLPVVTFEQARALAEAIVRFRNDGSGPDAGPFRTWQQFILFLRKAHASSTYNRSGGPDLDFLADRAVQDLVISNACPNLMSNQFLPERHRYLEVSKLDLGVTTTEFCFGPMGFFEVQSLGWVASDQGETLARALLTTEVQIGHVQFRSSQRDFLDDLLEAENVATGPEPLGNVRNSVLVTDDPLLDQVYGDRNGTAAGHPIARGGSPYEGWIQALCEDLTVGGQKTDFAARWPARPLGGDVFHAPYHVDFDDGGGLAASGESGRPSNGANLSKKSGGTIYAGESLTPDGVLFFNYSDEELQYPLDVPGLAGQGTIEFFLKLSSGRETAAGAHEPILYWVLPTSPPGAAPQTGVVWKLERYGTILRSTRFFYTNPPPQTLDAITGHPGMVELWNEIRYDFSGGPDAIGDLDWVHVAHSWTGYTGQQLWINGRLAGLPFRAGDAQAATATDDPLRISLASVPTSPIERSLWPGGLLFDNRNPSGIGIYRGATDPATFVARLANCKIDQIRISPTAAAQASDLDLRGRFDVHSSLQASEFRGAFEIERTGRVDLIAATVLYPTGHGNRSFVAAGPNHFSIADRDVDVDIDCRLPGGAIRATGQGRKETPSPVAAAAGDRAEYRIRFRGNGVPSSRRIYSTAIVDDLMVYLTIEPAFTSYQFVTD